MIDPTRERHDPRDAEGMSRRGFLECMTWVGTGLVWTVAGGVLSSRALAQPATGQGAPGDFRFVQISDSHIGFKGDANPDVLATFHDAIAKINVIDPAPAFVLHTGDLSHTQKPGAFDTVTESLKGVKTGRVFYVPGENDVFADGGKEYLSRYGQGTVRNGHIHQIMQKVEGNIPFHTAMSTAWPQPAPGAAPSPGPMKVPAERLRSVLGVRDVTYVQGRSRLAIIDSPLGER